MSAVAVAAVVGYCAARFYWTALHHTLHAPSLTRTNYRGRVVATAAGIVLPLALLTVEAVRGAAGALGVRDVRIGEARVLVVIAVVGFAMLGLVDDVFGVGEVRGFRGHVDRLLRGEITTGMLKLVGGSALAVVVVSPSVRHTGVHLFADAALVALCANLANLLDRRPGRLIKCNTAAAIVLIVTTTATHVLVPIAVVAGAALALVRDDLHEHLMLGDTGANALGAAVGVGVVLSCSPATRVGVLIVVAALNLASEFVSFTSVIEAIAPLRWLDNLGRTP
jgi:UDP-N-acetylmuramyl pentapeptide phosphotransferase/UDP-N-acetylglucosamine-1-phosphate transferase